MTLEDITFQKGEIRYMRMNRRWIKDETMPEAKKAKEVMCWREEAREANSDWNHGYNYLFL
jgi:hypothetical protein